MLFIPVLSGSVVLWFLLLSNVLSSSSSSSSPSTGYMSGIGNHGLFFFFSWGRGYLFPARPADIIRRIKGLDEIREWRTVPKVKWRGRRRWYRFYKGRIAWDSINSNTATQPRSIRPQFESRWLAHLHGSNLELKPFKSTPSLLWCCWRLSFPFLNKPNSLLLAVFPF